MDNNTYTRLLNERDELATRIEKLLNWLNGVYRPGLISPTHHQLLKAQLHAMLTYQDILTARIKLVDNDRPNNP